MTSIHLFQAEKKDFENVYDLLIEFKEVELADLKLPNEDKTKLTQFINSTAVRVASAPATAVSNKKISIDFRSRHF